VKDEHENNGSRCCGNGHGKGINCPEQVFSLNILIADDGQDKSDHNGAGHSHHCILKGYQKAVLKGLGGEDRKIIPKADKGGDCPKGSRHGKTEPYGFEEWPEQEGREEKHGGQQIQIRLDCPEKLLLFHEKIILLFLKRKKESALHFALEIMAEM